MFSQFVDSALLGILWLILLRKPSYHFNFDTAKINFCQGMKYLFLRTRSPLEKVVLEIYTCSFMQLLLLHGHSPVTVK